MNMTSNVHTHTTWCDGMNTPREMADAAIACGFTDLGFSSHAPAPFDPDYPGMQDDAAYRADIAACKLEYQGRLNILCGMEQDYYTPIERANYDYVIGSVHYLPVAEGRYRAADDTVDTITAAIQERYGGDGLAMARDFYALSVKNVQRNRPDIVGHFDLVCKFNRGNRLFDETCKQYQNTALHAMDAVIDTVLSYNGMIELNTSSLYRGLRDVPYPAPFLLRHMAQRGVRVIVTTDSHRTTTLNAGFDQGLAFLAAAGFQQMSVLRGGAFVDIPLE